jgi:hypothetical protein
MDGRSPVSHVQSASLWHDNLCQLASWLLTRLHHVLVCQLLWAALTALRLHVAHIQLHVTMTMSVLRQYYIDLPVCMDFLPSQHFGVEPNNYPHRFIFIPYTTACPWVGLGTEACAPGGCSVWLNRQQSGFSLDEMAHELGGCLLSTLTCLLQVHEAPSIWLPCSRPALVTASITASAVTLTCQVLI